jgi:hypothetical protein
MIAFIRDVMHVLTMRCCDHAALISRQADTRLPVGQVVGLWLHVRICQGCARWTRHVAQLRLVLCEIHAQDMSASNMPQAARNRIAAVLRTREVHDPSKT